MKPFKVHFNTSQNTNRSLKKGKPFPPLAVLCDSEALEMDKDVLASKLMKCQPVQAELSCCWLLIVDNLVAMIAQSKRSAQESAIVEETVCRSISIVHDVIITVLSENVDISRFCGTCRCKPYTQCPSTYIIENRHSPNVVFVLSGSWPSGWGQVIRILVSDI